MTFRRVSGTLKELKKVIVIIIIIIICGSSNKEDIIITLVKHSSLLSWVYFI